MRLLIIEDSPLDYHMLVATLALQGVSAQGRCVDSAQQLHRALASQPWDLVISDHHLPGFSSGEAFAIVNALPAPPPFIIVSGMMGEEAAVEAMRQGVSDYLIKGRLARLGMAACNAVAAQQVRREKEAAEARLAQSQAQLRNLSTRLQTLVDVERAGMAREIHDEVGGTLTAIRFDLEVLDKHVAPAQQGRVQRTLAAVAQAQHATQRIIRNLRPPILDAGLVAALEWQVHQFRERMGVAARFHCNVSTLTVGAPVAMTVYRACQEALTNIAKHAGATQVSVDMHCSEGVLSLEVSDDGKGFEPSALGKPDSLGLRGMAERVAAVNGQVDICSTPGRTTLMLWLPLDGGDCAAQQAAA